MRAAQGIILGDSRTEKMWTLPQPDFQISKTYCLQLLPGNPRLHIRNTAIVDFTFCDSDAPGARSYPQVVASKVTDTAWRRGYYSNTVWDRKVPQRNEPDGVVSRFAEHKRGKMKPPNLEDEFERAARQRTKKLLRRRERWNLQKKAAMDSTSSDSSSSSSTEDNDSS